MIYDIHGLCETIATVATQYDILEIRLFGSYFDGTPTEASDVDLIVKYGANCCGLDRVQFMIELEKHLGKEVDVLNVEFLPVFLAQGDLNLNSKLIFQRED